MNSSMFDKHLITIDIDWASDEIVDYVSGMLLGKNVKATWFITHYSSSIRRLADYPETFELGLHPNFRADSSQGSSLDQVMRYLRRILPHSELVRMHGLVQSTRLLSELVARYGITVDVSLCLYNTPLITPHEVWFAKGEKSLLRIPYFWEDDYELNAPAPCWSFNAKRYHCRGLKVFNFHPVHIALNSKDDRAYSTIRDKKRMQNLTLAEIDPYVNREAGTHTLFMGIVDYLSEQKEAQFTIGDIARSWREVHE